MAYLHGFVASIKTASELEKKKRYSLCSDSEEGLIAAKQGTPSMVIPLLNSDHLNDNLKDRVERLSPRQRQAYEAATEAICWTCESGKPWKQLIMFLSGEGGTGHINKST
jgi:hypothetical protein